MQVFKIYLKIMKKQLGTILLYGFIFLGIVNINVTSQYKERENQFGIKKIPIHIVNENGESPVTDALIEHIKQYAEIREIEDKPEARQDALFHRQVAEIITIPENFAQDLIEGRDVSILNEIIPGDYSALTVNQAINDYINSLQLYLKYNEQASIEQINEWIAGDTVNTQVSLDREIKENVIKSREFNMLYFSALGYIIISCFVSGVGEVMLSFHGLDIRRRQFSAPISNHKYNFQMILGNFVFVMMYLLVFIVTGYFNNPNRRMDAHLTLTWLNAFAFSITVLGISYFIGITVKNRSAVAAISTTLSLGLAFISGMFVPQEFLGDAVLRVAAFTPSYWYVRTNDLIYSLSELRLDKMSGILGGFGIQAGFAAAIFSMALVASKRKKQQEA